MNIRQFITSCTAVLFSLGTLNISAKFKDITINNETDLYISVTKRLHLRGGEVSRGDVGVLPQKSATFAVEEGETITISVDKFQQTAIQPINITTSGSYRYKISLGVGLNGLHPKQKLVVKQY
jgi:hypothetical protein